MAGYFFFTLLCLKIAAPKGLKRPWERGRQPEKQNKHYTSAHSSVIRKMDQLALLSIKGWTAREIRTLYLSHSKKLDSKKWKHLALESHNKRSVREHKIFTKMPMFRFIEEERELGLSQALRRLKHNVNISEHVLVNTSKLKPSKLHYGLLQCILA